MTPLGYDQAEIERGSPHQTALGPTVSELPSVTRGRLEFDAQATSRNRLSVDDERVRECSETEEGNVSKTVGDQRGQSERVPDILTVTPYFLQPCGDKGRGTHGGTVPGHAVVRTYRLKGGQHFSSSCSPLGQQLGRLESVGIRRDRVGPARQHQLRRMFGKRLRFDDRAPGGVVEVRQVVHLMSDLPARGRGVQVPLRICQTADDLVQCGVFRPKVNQQPPVVELTTIVWPLSHQWDPNLPTRQLAM